MGGVEYQVTKVDPTDPHTKGAVYQVHKVSEEVAATLGGKVYRARIIKDPTEPTVAGKVYQIVLIGDPSDPAVKGKVYNAILTGGSEAVVIGPAVSPLALPDAIANSLSYVKAFGGTEQRNLPSGYTQLEYIEMTGAQYLNTGITGYANTNVLKTKISASQVSTTCFITFQNPTSGENNLGLFQSSRWYFQYGSPARLSSITSVNTDVSIEATNGVLTVNGVSVTGTAATEFSISDPILIGAAINDTTVDSRMFRGKIYYFRWEDSNGNVLFDGVPAKDDNNVVGMYDTVSGAFLTNDGTGTFAAGGEATPTPDTPMDIVSNNGVLKYSANMANVNAQTALVGYYISTSGVVTASLQNWIYQDYIPVEPNTTYTITMSSPVYFVSISEYSTADDSGFIVHDASGSGTHTQFTITTSANTHFVRFGANIDGSSSVTLESVLAINWQLNKGNSMPYTPYIEGGIYTDGTVETINAHGKNLYNKADGVLFGYPAGNYIWMQRADNTTELTIMVRLKEGSTYTVTRAANSVATFRIQASATSTLTSGQSLVNINSSGSSTTNTKTFTVPVGYPYVLFYVRNTAAQSSLSVDDVINAFQVELGSTATEYAPYYDGGTATAEMLLKVGNYQDVQSILDGVITRNVGIKVLDGTEDWAFRNQSLSLFYATIADTYFNDSQANHLALSTHFLGVEVNNTNMPDNSCKCASLAGTNSLQVFVKSTNFAAPEDIKSWLASQYAAGTPVIVVYPLATPTTESVAGQTLQVQDGDNVLEITQASLSGLELEAKYEKVA